MANSPACFSSKRAFLYKSNTGDRAFLKMYYHLCVSGCGRYLAPQDSHYCCLVCPGIQHAEETFVNGSCSSCGDMTISEFGNVKHGGVPLCLCWDLAFIPAPLPLDRAGTFVEVLMWNPPPRTPIIRGWTSGFLVGVVLVLSDPLWYHSSRKCMRSLQDRGRHLSLLETNRVAPHHP